MRTIRRPMARCVSASKFLVFSRNGTSAIFGPMIIGLVDSPVAQVDAVGTPVLGKTIDLANARITFESGCIANVTASRVSYKTERRMQ